MIAVYAIAGASLIVGGACGAALAFLALDVLILPLSVPHLKDRQHAHDQRGEGERVRGGDQHHNGLNSP